MQFIGLTIHQPNLVLYAYGPPPSLCMICIGSNAFMQFAPIRRPTGTSSLCTISFDVGVRCFHSLILAGVAISSLSTGISFLAYNFGSPTQLLSSFIPVTFMPSTTIVFSVLSPCNVFKFKVVFMPRTPISLT